MKNSDIHIRDPYVLVQNGKYYLYGSRGGSCWGQGGGFDVYTGTDLENWEGPFEVFHNDGSFWTDREYWAPECHVYNGAYYLLASFKNEGVCRGTQILRAERPEGPFAPISDGPVTPRNWECLDGTLYVSPSGDPWMVFCHEWVQAGNGEVCAIPLTPDLRAAAGEARILFRAGDAPKIAPMKNAAGQDCFVTDGPFLHRTADGTLLMIWSSFSTGGYCVAVARSDNGDITGNWILEDDLLFERDGGHGMIFRTLGGQLMLALHTPNAKSKERPKFYPIREQAGSLCRETL